MKRVFGMIALAALAAVALADWRGAFDDAFFAHRASAPASMPTGLVAHWKMNDDAANTTVEDSAGDFDGVSEGQNTANMSVAGKIGKALYFSGVTEGVGDYISTTYLGVPGTAHRTATAWFRFNGESFAWNCLMAYSDGERTSQQNEYNAILSDSGKFCWQIGYGTKDAAESVHTIATNTWYFMARTYDGATMYDYINCELDGSNTVALKSVTNVATPFTIGWIADKSGWAAGWVGAIDDVRFYERCLTTQEIALIYNGGAGTED